MILLCLLSLWWLNCTFEIFWSFFMAASAFSSTLNGDSGVGFSRAWINCDATISDVSSEYILGMSKWLGENSTVYEVLSVLVLII